MIFGLLQTAKLAYFQRKIQLSGLAVPINPDKWSSSVQGCW